MQKHCTTPKAIALLICLSLFVVTSVSFARGKVGPQPTSTLEYYPLQKGNHWDFNLSTQGQQLKMTNRVAKLEKIDGQSLFRIETTMNGQVIATEHLSQTPKGLFRNRYNGIELNPPLQLLRQPVKLGASWKRKIKMGPQQVQISCRLGKEKEKTKVPAGEFEALKLHVDTQVNGQAITSTYWFTSGVGIVKQKLDLAGQKANVELVAFKLAEPETNSPAKETPAKETKTSDKAKN